MTRGGGQCRMRWMATSLGSCSLMRAEERPKIANQTYGLFLHRWRFHQWVPSQSEPFFPIVQSRHAQGQRV